MHELSIAVALVEELRNLARQQHATRIVELELHCGVMQQVVAESLQMAFQAASADTPAAGATLRIVPEAVVARCRACLQEFAAEIDNYLCPHCRVANVEIIAGRDITLRCVICELEGGSAR
jgi:hydrogenase nickel incorporation protein HypA/HybF